MVPAGVSIFTSFLLTCGIIGHTDRLYESVMLCALYRKKGEWWRMVVGNMGR